jgi:hypothetical protein
MIHLEEWSAQREYLYQTTGNTHKKDTFMSPEGIEPTIPANEWPQTHALDRAVSGISSPVTWCFRNAISRAHFTRPPQPLSHGVSEMREVEPTSLGPLISETDVVSTEAENNSFQKGLS